MQASSKHVIKAGFKKICSAKGSYPKNIPKQTPLSWKQLVNIGKTRLSSMESKKVVVVVVVVDGVVIFVIAVLFVVVVVIIVGHRTLT